MSDRIIPMPAFGAPRRTALPGDDSANSPHDDPSGRLARRELDLRRTEAPDPGPLPATRRRHPRRYGVTVFDPDGRIGERALFRLLGWSPGTRVEIGVNDAEDAIVMRRAASGGGVVTASLRLLVPARVRRWCGFGTREQVLVVAVPTLSALVVHGLEKLDLVLPDPRAVVKGMHPVGERGERAGGDDGSEPAADAGRRGRSGSAGGDATGVDGRGGVRDGR
ncbi:hypothetical protein [Saccharothrix sp. ALI-22-I]|uniref:hypothetical protein n=1 Tax=Saccharothrix sp. ALI-22-I TaxID=1933778 RepID=UPI00117B10DD|nr:hypothetical protein [Saccharothrix sp. ALI-22-I]